MRLRGSSRIVLETYLARQSSSWRNPVSGNYGTATRPRTWQSPTGDYCREFQHTIVVGGETHQAYGTARRQPDGSERIQP